MGNIIGLRFFPLQNEINHIKIFINEENISQC